MRLAVPNANKLMGMYFGADLGIFDELNDGCRDSSNQIEKLHSLMNAGHHAIYDYDSLNRMMNKAGFVVLLSSFRNCQEHPGMEKIWRETLDMFPDLSLYVNAFPMI